MPPQQNEGKIHRVMTTDAIKEFDKTQLVCKTKHSTN